MAELFHIAERSTWLEAAQAGEYRMSTRGITLADQGFIHCSARQQLPAVAELLYSDVDDDELVVLVVDSDRISVPIRYEAAEPGGQEFPHIYGALPATAVIDAMRVKLDAAGHLVLPG